MSVVALIPSDYGQDTDPLAQINDIHEPTKLCHRNVTDTYVRQNSVLLEIDDIDTSMSDTTEDKYDKTSRRCDESSARAKEEIDNLSQTRNSVN